MKVKLTLEYNGSGFHGWQKQNDRPDLVTVQGELEEALQTFLKPLVETEVEPIPITASGRTDKGVHARAQVASFTWPLGLEFDPERLKSALNGITKKELTVLKVEAEKDDFDARLTPHRKQYSYRILIGAEHEGLLEGLAIRSGGPLDVASMIKAARYFVGTHDFSSFRSTDCTAKTTERIILVSELTRISERELVYSVQGKGFLMHMVRIIVGTLLEVGRGKILAEQIPEIIALKDRNKAGPTAPPQGLYLDWVKY